jgi:hypothetical protein
MGKLFLILMGLGGFGSVEAQARCSSNADGFVFAFHTAPLLHNGDAWVPGNRLFSQGYSFRVLREFEQDGEQLIYADVFHPGDRRCDAYVMRSDDLFFFEETRFVLPCVERIDGLVARTASPYYRNADGDWQSVTNRSYAANYEFEIVETIPVDGDEIVIMLFNFNDSGYNCSFGAALKSELLLFEEPTP